MKYLSDNHDIIIEAQGGYAALEALGFVSENSLNVLLKKQDRSEKIKAWVAENCCSNCKKKHELCSCTPEEKEMAKAKKTDAKVVIVTKDSLLQGLTRNQMMLEVQRRGIKNFRVMNKEELSEIVGGKSEQRRSK